jgi:S-sulfosulfanyl-L-cysteine sulfohydrolase
MSQSLTILQINDLHGYTEPHVELVRTGGGEHYRQMGGLARIATAFTEVRRERSAVIALDNGDTFHGTYVAVASKGEALVPLMNALGLDAMTVHWEFAYGPAGVKRLAQQLSYPILAINCYQQDGGELFLPPYRMVERGGLRVAIIGIASNIVDKTMPPSYSEGLRFTLGRDELPRWIAHARQQEAADLVVVLSHLGFPQDIKLAGEVDGIDVLVSGHTHNRMERAVVENGAIVFQSGCHGAFIGRLDLELDSGKVIAWRHQLVPIDERFAPDPTMERKVEAAMTSSREFLSQKVGQTEIVLSRYEMLQSTMDDLLLDAIAAAAGTDIAFSNGWRYGAPIVPGPMTMNDLWNMIPTNPPVSTVELSGAELLTMLEESLERTFAADPYAQMGGYVKRCRGLSLYVKIENPPGQRVERLFVQGEAVEPARSYEVAFVTEQGVAPKFGRNRRIHSVRAIDALRDYLARGPVTGRHCTTVQAV